MADNKIRAVIDGAKGKHIVDLSDIIVSESRNEITGRLKQLSAFGSTYKQFELEKDIRIETLLDGNWREIWDGYIFNPKFNLGPHSTTTTAKNHTAKLMNTFIDEDYYFDEVSQVAKKIMEANGFVARDIESRPFYTNNFSGVGVNNIDDWTEQTDANWALESGVYSGNDGADHDVTVFDGRQFTDCLVSFTPNVQSGSSYGLVFRYQDSNNYYFYDFGQDEIWAKVSGTTTSIGQPSPSGTADGSECRVWMEGVDMAIAIGDGNEPDYFFDGALNTGKVGFFVDNSHVHFDNLSIYPASFAVHHFNPTRITMFSALQQLRLLSFIGDSNGADFWMDRGNNLHWQYRDLNEPAVMELEEGVNILGGSVFQDYESVRNKVSIYGTTKEQDIPRKAAQIGFFTTFDTDGWIHDGTWTIFAYDPVKIDIRLTGDDVETTYANFPYHFASANWGISTSEYPTAKFTLDRENAVTNFHVHLRFYEDAATYVDQQVTNPPTDPTETSVDITGIDTVNYMGMALHNATLVGGAGTSVLVSNIYFERTNTGIVFSATDSDTIFDDTREYEETNTSLGTFDRGIQYAKAQLELRKQARWKGNLTVKGNPILRVGVNVKVKIPSTGLDQVMRVSGAEHTITGGTYITRITLDENESLLAEELARVRSAITESRNRDIPASVDTVTVT
jgi:hypothetical protein